MKPEPEEQLHALKIQYDQLFDQLVLFPELQPEHESKLIKTAQRIGRIKRKVERESRR